MVLRSPLGAALVLAVAMHAPMAWAQPPGPADPSGWTAAGRPPAYGESPEPQPVGSRVDLPSGSPQTPPAELSPELASLRAAMVGAPPQSPPSTLDEADFDRLPTVDLATTAEPKHASGLRDFWGYRYERSSLDWIVGHGDQFGMFSLHSDHYQRAGEKSGLGVGLDFHFTSGPVQTEMPPRLYDFSLAYQCRTRVGVFAYDLAASVTASSDFEGSAREGIRYPAHAVGFLQIDPSAELVFGVDYLDRGDIKLLPVGGVIWIPRDDVRLELVFPRPRATFALPMFGRGWLDFGEDCRLISPRSRKERRLYVAGDLGGGTWAVERGGMHDDLATYRELQLSLGLECVDQSGSRSAIEVAYLFERRLEFTSGSGNMRLDDTVMLRWISSY